MLSDPSERVAAVVESLANIRLAITYREARLDNPPSVEQIREELVRCAGDLRQIADELDD